MNNKIIVMGLGKVFDRYKYLINLSEVVCWLDNNSTASLYEGLPVIKNEYLNNYNYDYIVIFSIKLYESMANELIWKYGVDSNNIVSYQWYYKDNICQYEKKISDAFVKITNVCQLRNILDFDGILVRYAMWSSIKNLVVDKVGKENVSFLNRLYKKIYDLNIEKIEKKYDVVLMDISNHNISVNYIQKIFKITNCIIFEMGKEYRNKLDISISENIDIYNIHGYIFGALFKNYDKINIYQVAHKKFIQYNSKIYNTIWVGKENVCHSNEMTDNVGDNIAYLNDKINELTALYWIWKNSNDDIVGLNHYRRCFMSIVNSDYAALNKIEVLGLLNKYDFIIAQGVGAPDKSEKSDIRNCLNAEAFDIAWNVLKGYFSARTIEEQQALEYVFNNQIIFPCNMFITRKLNIDKYCEWLFPIVFYMVRNTNINEKWDGYSKRIIGFLMERMFTVWLVLNQYSICEVPINFIEN